MGKGKDFWLDDPEWEVLRRKAENRPVTKDLRQRMAKQRPGAKTRREEPRAQTKREDTDKEVVVNLKLAIPKVKPPDLKHLYRTHKRKIIKAGALSLAVIVAFGAFKLFSTQQRTEEAKKPVAPEEQAQQAFNPLVPLEGFADAGGKKSEPAFKYDTEKKVLGYTSRYNEAKIVVSQQALPDQLKTHPGQIEGIARSVNANVPVDTQKGRVYIATNDKTGEQVVIFATEEVLVFINSNKELDNESWKIYINQLNSRQ